MNPKERYTSNNGLVIIWYLSSWPCMLCVSCSGTCCALPHVDNFETVAGVCRTCFTACCATCLKSTGSFTSTQTKSFILPPFFLVASLTRASLRKSCCALQGFTATSDHTLCYILPVPTLSNRFLLWMYSRWPILARTCFLTRVSVAEKVFQTWGIVVKIC